MIFERLIEWIKPRTVSGPALNYAIVAVVASFVIFFGFWSFGAGLEVLVIPVLPILAIAYRSVLLGSINLGWILFLSYFYDFGWAHDVTDGTALIGAWIALPVIIYVIALFRCDTLRSAEEIHASEKPKTVAWRNDESVEQNELPQLFFLAFFIFVATGILLASLEFTTGYALSKFHLKPYGLRIIQLIGTLFVGFVIVEIILRSINLRSLTRFDARYILQQELWSTFGREQELFGSQRQKQKRRSKSRKTNPSTEQPNS